MFSEFERENVSPWVAVNGRSSTLPRKVYSPPTKRQPPPPKRVTVPSAPPAVRELAGPRTGQEVGYGPFHEVRGDARRFDFSKPTPLAAPLSLINATDSATALAEAEEQEHAIRLFHCTYGSHAARAASNPRAQNVHCEANDPLSALRHVSLERFTGPPMMGDPAGQSASGDIIQPCISASYIQKQTAQKMAAKAEQLALYQREVQERLNKRVQEQRQKEKERRATLPPKVQTLVYSKQQQPQTTEPAAVEIQPLPSPSQSLEEFLAQGSPSRHVQEREHSADRRPSPVRPGTAGATTARAAASTTDARVQLSKAESLAYMLQMRKEESAASRARVQALRASGQAAAPSSGFHSARSKVAFGASGLFPRDARTPSPPRPRDERDLIALARRNPAAFSVRQQLAIEEPPTPERVLHVPQPALKPRMSDAVAGKRLPKKERPAAGAHATAEKNSAYRRLVLERLHTLSASLGHPLPPLCACGFTPKDEYDLLFAYGGSIQTVSVAPPAQQSQPAFNLSTAVARGQADASIHQRAHPSPPTLSSHVTVDSTRHAYQHKHNCQYHQAPEAYVKALASLLHLLEDQQQI